MTITTKNPKNQQYMNRAIKYLKQHNIANTKRDEIENNYEGDDVSESAAWRKINRKCEDTFNKYLDELFDLPKYEQKRLENSEIYNS